MNPIQIDGSYGEGGGQIIRTCLSLSAITGKPFSIQNIRAGRTKPGLQPQHLAAVKAASAICSAKLVGAHVGSVHLTFEPTTPAQSGDYSFEIGTAGAATLVAQTVMLPLSLAKESSQVNITGGTHVPHSPPAAFLREVYLLALKDSGFPISADYVQAGFFPKGGGNLRITIGGRGDPMPITLAKRGKLCSLTAFVITAGLPDHVSHRGEMTIRNFMKGIGRQIEVVSQTRDSIGPGAAVILVCQCEGGMAGFTSLGERGKPMEKVSEQACGEFMEWWKTGAACDKYLADQLVLPAALAIGESAWSSPRITDHLRTVLRAVQQFLPINYNLDENADSMSVVRVRSMGLTSK